MPELSQGKPVIVYGMGKSGKAVARAMQNIIVGDDNPDNLKEYGNILDINTQDFSKAAFLVLSPGIPLTHPVAQKAQKAGLEIICDIELFFRIHPDLKIIGVTGTNGKSTTVSLISHILRQAGIKNALGGNIGTAVFDMDIMDIEWVVLEMSSYQIELCPHFRPDISVILNITPDHIDRHGSIENYAAVKAKMFEGNGSAIICTQDEYTKAIAKNTKRELIEVHADGYSQNIACAYEVAKKIGIKDEDISRAIKSFPGLNHRQFFVRNINGVDYINDSKATNAASTATALECRDNIYWIVGGRKKEGGLAGLEKFADKINHAFLIGESTEEFSNWFEVNKIAYSKCYTMEDALNKAYLMANSGVVLLSPACASFDQYKSFEHRGDRFAKLVEELKEDE